MADDDRTADISKLIECRANAVRMGRIGIVVWQVRRDDSVAGAAQAVGERAPARTVVPFPVDQAERGDARSLM